MTSWTVKYRDYSQAVGRHERFDPPTGALLAARCSIACLEVIAEEPLLRDTDHVGLQNLWPALRAGARWPVW